ncbi:unnamed protein product [Eruca vesicaria subsp. sativa]|uniref:ZF-HD dimerization-type domain-containing protein n=1 Tax=Eruca vesicaria subsp. sativa TaxID=29727 RepID=A0ABC8M3F6_ERUVS|nr:unnamed protein product [Eruca vesicaria subsp. sativa]
MDETKSKTEEKCKRRTKPTPICCETGDHVHSPPTRPPKPTPPPPHAPSPTIESLLQLSPKPHYGECRKNQAASTTTTTAYDGCGEFVSANPAEDSLNCAACGCHRTFHLQEPLSDGAILEILKISPLQFRQIFCSPYGNTEERIVTDRSNEEGAKKRVKRRFTEEQREKMRSYAEKVGWKVSTESRERVKEFCDGIGVTRKNLRVWMNNNHNGVNGRRLDEEEGRVRKRFKTKFTAEQTEKMRRYAEKLTWKVRAEDRVETEGFCGEIGVSWNSFMIWMNNHKEERD